MYNVSVRRSRTNSTLLVAILLTQKKMMTAVIRRAHVQFYMNAGLFQNAWLRDLDSKVLVVREKGCCHLRLVETLQGCWFHLKWCCVNRASAGLLCRKWQSIVEWQGKMVGCDWQTSIQEGRVAHLESTVWSVGSGGDTVGIIQGGFLKTVCHIFIVYHIDTTVKIG